MYMLWSLASLSAALVTQAPSLASPPEPTPLQPLVHGSRAEPCVALTFDACATRAPNGYDARVVEVLVATNTPATLFLSGKWLEREPDEARHLASLPNIEIASHGYAHRHLTRMSDEAMQSDLVLAQETFMRLLGQAPLLFRPPYAESSDRLARVAAELGLVTVTYDLASGDPDARIPKHKLIDYVVDMAKNGAIVVMHMNLRGWHTADALPDIIAGLRHRGFELVTVSELEARQARLDESLTSCAPGVRN